MTFKASCAAVTGAAHRQLGTPCQDSVCIRRENNILCAVLADGAGSRCASHLGADCVTDRVCGVLCERFGELSSAQPDTIAQIILQNCLEGLDRLPQPRYDLASTLLFFAADEKGRFLSGHLGDGVQILVIGASARVFSAPENGDDPGVTWFVTSPDALEHLRIKKGVLTPGGTMLLMSDGMAAGLYHQTTGDPAPACVTISGWMREESEEVISRALEENMKTLFSRKSTDDLSLAVISW